MKSLIALLAVVLTCAVAVPAGASPIQDAPAHSRSAPVVVPAPDGDTAAIVYVLIGAGAALAFGAGGFMGARSVQTRRVRPTAG
jgi:hypothetical protein